MIKFIKITSAVLLVILFSIQFTKLKIPYEKARLRALSEVPHDSFDDVVAAAQGRKPLTPQRMDAYVRYARLITRLDPDRADAFGLMGFCFFQQGDYKQAITFYSKAAFIEPGFFGFHYNLAYIHFKQGNFPQALEEVQKAILCDPKASLYYILTSSPVYALMLVTKINAYGIRAEQQIKNGYEKAYLLMAAIEYRLISGLPFPGEEQLSLEGY